MSGIFDQVINYAPPSLLKGTVTYKGTWSAATNTPTLINPPDSTTNGHYYVVSAAGTQFSLSFNIGDWIISNGSAWEKVDNTDAVSSVFGRTGAVVGVSTDYSSVGITATAVGASGPSTGAFTTLSATTPLAVASGGTGVTTSTGTTNVVLSGSPTITTPVIAQINDANGNETLKLASIALAVNEVTIENAATGNPVHIRATGGDASVGLHLVAKGASGYVNVTDGVDETKRLMFNASGGTTNTRTMLSSTQTVDRTLSLPDATDTLVGKATTDTLTNKTITGGILNGTLGATTPSTVAATTITTTSTAGIGGAATFNSTVDQSFSSASTLQLTQTNTNTGAGAGVSIFQYNSGTGAGGDTWIRQFAGTENWSFGVDNSDSSAWKVSRSGTLGTNDVLKLTSTGLNSTAIGATTPSTGAFTTISASGTISGNANLAFVADNATGTYSRYKYNSSNRGIIGSANNVLSGGSTTDFAIGTENAGNLILSSNNSSIAVISSAGAAITGALSCTTGASFATSSGVVNIGSSSPSFGAKLNVSNGASTQSSILVLNPGVGSAQIGIAAASANFKLYNSYSDGTLANGVGIDITSSGNVGIGTTSPAYPLMILRRSGSTITEPLINLQSQSSGSVDGDSYILYGTQAANWSAGVDQADSNKFRIEPASTLGGATGLTITTAGNVGIGTTSPLRALGIDGGLAFQTSGGASRAIHWMDTATSIASLLVSGNAPSGFISFSTNTLGSAALERMIIDSAGNVGIGTTSPATPLHVATAGGSGATIASFGSTANVRIKLINSDATYGATIQHDAGDPFFIVAGGAGSGAALALGSNGTERMRIASGGGIKFNTYGAGTATFDASGNITSVSDERIKKNIRPFSRGLSEIIAINPILHGYSIASGLDQSRDDYAGFSAQQVQPLIPEAIGVNADGMLSFSDRPIMAALVNAVKELSARLAALESK
jgi:hypothetical protein